MTARHYSKYHTVYMESFKNVFRENIYIFKVKSQNLEKERNLCVCVCGEGEGRVRGGHCPLTPLNAFFLASMFKTEQEQ